jgi:hypothetical protein
MRPITVGIFALLAGPALAGDLTADQPNSDSARYSAIPVPAEPKSILAG